MLLYLRYFSSHLEYSLYHTSNVINISGMKMLSCILIIGALLLNLGGMLRL